MCSRQITEWIPTTWEKEVHNSYKVLTTESCCVKIQARTTLRAAPPPPLPSTRAVLWFLILLFLLFIFIIIIICFSCGHWWVWYVHWGQESSGSDSPLEVRVLWKYLYSQVWWLMLLSDRLLARNIYTCPLCMVSPHGLFWACSQHENWVPRAIVSRGTDWNCITF